MLITCDRRTNKSDFIILQKGCFSVEADKKEGQKWTPVLTSLTVDVLGIGAQREDTVKGRKN